MIVNNTKAKVVSINGKALIPGTNTVNNQWWAKARKHPSIKKKIDRGDIVEETEFKQPEKGQGDDDKTQTNENGLNANPKAAYVQKITLEDVEHIETLNVRDAQRLIKETYSSALLNKWWEHEAETKARDGVCNAIEKQLEVIEADPELRDRDAATLIETGQGVEEVEVNATPRAEDD